jgi:hypothetical protein
MTNTIISTGYAPSPIPEDTKPIRRTVKVVAKRNQLLNKGIVAMDFLRLTGSGNDPLVDSWDSRLGPYQRNSHLNKGGVAVLNGTMDLGNHTVAGDLYLGNDATLAGNKFSATGTNYGWVMQYPPASLPTNDINGNPLPPIWPDAPGTSQSHTFTNSGYYTIRDTGDLIVNPGVTVNLDIEISSYDLSKSTISIAGATPNDGTLKIFQKSGTAAFGGQNSSGATNRPINFQYFGLPGVTSVSIGGGNSTFQGVIYAPQADLTMNGGGGNNINFAGGFVVKSLTDDGHFLIHYDQSLAGYYYSYFVVGSWQEIPPPTN